MDLDQPTVDDLRHAGSVKWSTFPDKIGSFIAEMDFGTAPAVTRALHDAVDAGLLGYLPGWLWDGLADAASTWLRRHHHWEVPPERIRPLGDVIGGLQAAIEHFSEPGSAVIIPTPAYMPFLTVPKAMGRELIEVPLQAADGRYAYDLEALDAAFAAGANLLVLCNPHNPIGRVLEREELLAISEVVERHGGRVFADEIHAPLVFPGHQHVSYATISPVAAAHTVTAISASKAWNLPGMKCAQLVLSNDADAARWAQVGTGAEHAAATLGVVANTAAYSSGEEWLGEVLDHLDGNRKLLGDLLAERLPEVGYRPPEGTYLAFLDCRALELGERPADFFAEYAGVALTDGSECGVAGRGFVRLNFATPRPILEATVDAMAAAVRRR